MKKRKDGPPSPEEKKKMQDSIIAGLKHIAKEGIIVDDSSRELKNIMERMQEQTPWLT